MAAFVTKDVRKSGCDSLLFCSFYFNVSNALLLDEMFVMAMIHEIFVKTILSILGCTD